MGPRFFEKFAWNAFARKCSHVGTHSRRIAFAWDDFFRVPKASVESIGMKHARAGSHGAPGDPPGTGSEGARMAAVGPSLG